MTLADRAISVTELVGKAASFGEKALPFAQFVAGFIPGAAPVLQVVSIALPIIHRINAAAPVVVKALEAGRPILDAVEQSGPNVLPYLKELYALAVNHDPARPETSLVPENVSTKEVLEFAGPVLLGRKWTPAEEKRFFDKATGEIG